MTEISEAKAEADPVARFEGPLVPLHFPGETEVPETSRHLELRTALFLVLKANFAATAAIGSDQFVYWDPTDPSECLAPDAFVRLGKPHAPFDSWKVWERGAPEIAVEILSRSDGGHLSVGDKRAKYARLGVRELVIFDPDGGDRPLQVWSFQDGGCAERVLESPGCSWSEVLAVYFVVVDDAATGPMLRLSRDPEGKHLLPTPEETERAARETEHRARIAAEQRVAELEAELSRIKR